MKVRYDGPYEEGVDLVLPPDHEDGESVHVKKGENTPDLPKEVAENLLEQGTWKRARKES